MIETNIQQQQDHVSMQPSLHEPGLIVEAGMTVTCAICDAVYAPSPQQLPFLQYTQGALEATFMSMCHFCFRCRRAACPQCWDDVHGVCGACVQDARLPFRTAATPLDDLTFPPASQQSSHQSQQQQVASLFAPIRNGRFSMKTAARPEPDIVTDPVVQPVVAQAITPNNPVRESEQNDTPAALAVAVAIPTKTPLPEASKGTRKQKKKPRIATEAKKTSRLELVFTWIVLVIVLVLVVVIALAEFIPAVNTLVAHVTHIDIHAEIAYLVSIVQQLFKR